jgi:diaminopimelate decarboxylase
VSALDLVAEHGSPLWLADVDRVRENAERFQEAWRGWPTRASPTRTRRTARRAS